MRLDAGGAGDVVPILGVRGGGRGRLIANQRQLHLLGFVVALRFEVDGNAAPVNASSTEPTTSESRVTAALETSSNT